jgi:hypothetical protein
MRLFYPDEARSPRCGTGFCPTASFPCANGGPVPLVIVVGAPVHELQLREAELRLAESMLTIICRNQITGKHYFVCPQGFGVFLRYSIRRIRARAIRRCGELIHEIPPGHGANQNIGTAAAGEPCSEGVGRLCVLQGLTER